jgi:hypothetical protein
MVTNKQYRSGGRIHGNIQLRLPSNDDLQSNTSQYEVFTTSIVLSIPGNLTYHFLDNEGGPTNQNARKSFHTDKANCPRKLEYKMYIYLVWKRYSA